MITIDIRKQGGAAIITIPAKILKMLDISIGSRLQLDVGKGSFTAKPVGRSVRKRYALKELLRGATPKKMAKLNAETAWAREGDPVGREIL